MAPSLRGFNRSVREQLRRELSGLSVEIPVKADFEGVRREAGSKGQAAGGEFAQSFKRRVEAALKALPDVKLDADASPAQREIAAIREELRTLGDATVGVDLDAGEATRRIDQLRFRLDQLGAEHTSIDLDVDTAAAGAQLAEIGSQVDRLDGRRANVDVDVDRSGHALTSLVSLDRQAVSLVSAGFLIGPAFAPGLAAAAFGALGLASALAGATAGVGAFFAASFPAFSAVTDAITATDQAEKAAATSAVTGTRQRVGAAYQAQQAAQRVADAQQQADRTSVDGARQVQDAQRQLGDTRRDVAQRIEDANERVADSERKLERSHEDVRRAQEALTDARREAIRTLQDLREESSDLALSEESAEIGLLRARQRLAEVNRSATATALDRREAALGVAEAEDRLSDVQRDRGRTAAELNDAERAGVNGSRQVIAANDAVRDASEQLAEARRDNADAQENLVRAEADGARAIADAERRVSDARTDAAQANADAARAVADAVAAQAQQQEQANLAAENGTAGARNLAYALSELSPWQRRLYDGFVNLRDAFEGWAQSLEPAIVPVFLQGMQLIEDLLPRLTPLVLATAGAFGELLDKAGRALQSPFWRDFFDYMARVAGPTISDLGDVVGDLVTGIAAILMAFEPMAGRVTGGLADLSQKFRDWALSIDASDVERIWGRISESVKDLIEDLKRLWSDGLKPLLESPDLKDFFKQWAEFHHRVWDKLMDAFVIFLKDVAPPLLKFTARMLEWLNYLDEHTGGAVSALAAIALILGSIAAIPGVGAVLGAVGTALGALGSGPLAVVVLGLAELALWTKWVFDHWGKWESVIPLFTGPIGIAGFILGGFIKKFDTLKETMGDVIDWVRDNWKLLPILLTGPLGVAYLLIVAHWDKIKGAFASAWHFIRDRVLKPLGSFWHDHIYPALRDARDFFGRIWEQIRKTAGAAWDKVVGVIRGAVNLAITIINKIGNAIETVAHAIGLDDFTIRDIPYVGESSRSAATQSRSNPNTTFRETGGPIPATNLAAAGSFITNGPRAIVGEGRRGHPEAVIATDPQFRARNVGILDWAASRLGFGIVPQFARGGVPNPVDAVTTAARAASQFVSGAGGTGLPGLISGGFSVADAVDKIKNAAKGLSRLGSKMWGIPKRALEWLRDRAIKWATDKVGSAIENITGSAGGIGRAYMGAVGSGVERWRDIALKALAYTGSPASWINSLLRRMNQESGGNPNAINLWDSNAARGTPSIGLMQTIGPTFQAYARELAGRGIRDPFANIVASIRYANARYGSAPRGWDRPGGYALGGIGLPFLGSFDTGTPRVPHDGLAFLHQNEAVLDASDAAMFRAAAMGSVKSNSYEQQLVFNGLTDPTEIARMASEEMAWMTTIGSH